MTATKTPAKAPAKRKAPAKTSAAPAKETLAIAPATETEIETPEIETPASQVTTDQYATETPDMGHVPTVAILSALDSAYAAIRRTHPDVPGSVAITLASGKGKSHGHFQGNAWRDTTAEGDVHAARHEINMASESLKRGGEATFTTLLHEAVHALAHATGVKDTSRQGRYHGSKFRDLAERVGLVCEADEKIGTRTVGLQSHAAIHYADQISALDNALTTYRAPEASKESKPSTSVKVQCNCEVPFTLSKKAWAIFSETLSCDLCREEDGEGRFHEID